MVADGTEPSPLATFPTRTAVSLPGTAGAEGRFGICACAEITAVERKRENAAFRVATFITSTFHEMTKSQMVICQPDVCERNTSQAETIAQTRRKNIVEEP